MSSQVYRQETDIGFLCCIDPPDRQDMNTVQENAAQRYTQTIVVPLDLEKVDWQAKPFPFKLYRNCKQIPLSRDVGTGSAQGQIGQMLRDIYGLTRLDQ